MSRLEGKKVKLFQSITTDITKRGEIQVETSGLGRFSRDRVARQFGLYKEIAQNNLKYSALNNPKRFTQAKNERIEDLIRKSGKRWREYYVDALEEGMTEEKARSMADSKTKTYINDKRKEISKDFPKPLENIAEKALIAGN